MTTKGSPDDTHVAHTSSGNKTANATMILGIVQTIFEALDGVPYVGMVAGLASTTIKVVQEVDTCKEEWDKVKATLLKIRDIVLEFQHGRDDSTPLPNDVRSAFQELEICLRDVLEAVLRYQDVNVGRRVIGRSALKAEATLCVGRIDMAVKVFQMKVLIGTRLVGDQTYNLVKEIFAILHLLQQGSLPSLSLNLDVLPCPASSQYFTGRKSDLQKLSRMLAAPVVTLSGMNSDALLAFVHRFEHSLRFTAIFLDASSVEALNMGLKAMVHNIRADDNAQKLHLLVLENADPSLELNKYLPISLHNLILIASTNEAVSHFASAQTYKFKLLDSADQFSVDDLYESISRAFDSLQHVVTIVAKGGTGKTQLVYRFVSENPSRFTHVWFLDATSNATLTADFETLGKAACVGGSVKDVKDFLRRMHEDWLVIFDNADDSNVDLSNYIPQCNHGSVIITSHLTVFNQIASLDSHIDFGDLGQSDAVDLLLKHAHMDYNNDNQQLASVIVGALGCQALAVATAGAYIASTATCTLSEYLLLFKQNRTQLLDYKIKTLDSYQKTVFSAFQLSFEKLSHSAKLFIQICAFFHHTAIPVELFYRASAFTGDDLWPEEKDKTPAVEDLKQFLSYFPCNASWNKVIDELNSLSLTIYDISAKTLSFHSVLQMCVQETIDDKEKICYTTGMLLARATSYSIKGTDYEFRRMLITHVESIHMNNCFTFLIYKSLVRIGEDAGFLMATGRIAEEALEYCEHSFGKYHHNTLIAMGNLAATYRQQRQLQKAEALEEETLKLRKKVLGELHPDTLKAMGNLAETYWEQGQLQKAEALEEETLKLRKKVLGELHPDTLEAMGNLAATYAQQGQLQKAEALEKETLKLRKKVLGELHPDTLEAMGNLAATYAQQGQLQKAEALEEETLKLQKKVLGELHPDTLKAMANLAETYWDQGQLQKAEALQEETLKLQKKVLGELHPDTLKAMANLAETYWDQGQLQKAEALQEETLKLQKKVLGKLHPDTLTAMANLAVAYRQQGQLQKAEALEEETLKLRKKVLGELHPDTLTAMANLAATYWDQGQLQKAEALEEETLKLQKKVLGELHPNTLTAMANLAATYREQGQLQKAEALEKETLKVRKKVLGELHPDTLTGMANLAATYRQQGQLKKAEALEEETLKLQKNVLGELHPNTLSTMGNLATTYREQGQLQKAEALGEESLKLPKQVF
ncbi:hypothetical protein IW261DRAFT_1408475 [Armillaria novae-zelandiae]|uniref:Kinesin light chain n=1 Tax=Armillaria novae-zelandiae TaxID=153914 RepID=A0AA39TLI5_9AGAR|nr:hypothetical protein IW261DRAFT_1408475 [Armillaria novae-zelandiae]